MSYQIENQETEIVDDFEGFDGWVGISSGDIYLDDEAFGCYVAAWYPNTTFELKILVSVLNEKGEFNLSIGAKCPLGNLDKLYAVDPYKLPWAEDGVIHSGFVKPQEFSNYSKADAAFKAAKYIVLNDASIKKYLDSKNA